MFNPDELTWRCDACKETRPDAQISVLSVEGTLGLTQVKYTRNWKYCNDRPSCYRTVESRGAQL